MTTPTKTVCFVCTANICRSPFAEFFLKQRAESAGLRISVISAGVSATDGQNCPDFLVDIAKDFEVDLLPHTSKKLTKEIVARSDLILGMERFHCNETAIVDPASETKTFLTRNFALQGSKTRDIKDPFGLSTDFIESCFDDIAEAIDGLILHLQKP